MKKFNLMVFVYILTFVSSYGQDTLSLQNALEIGLQQNFNIRLAVEDVHISSNNYTRGNAGMLPSIDLSAGFTKSSSNTKQEFVTGNNVDKSDARSSQYNAEIALHWTLFDGLKMFISFEKLAALKNQSDQLYKIQIEDFVYKLSMQYLILAKLQLDLKYDRELLQLAQEQFDWNHKKFEIEELPKTDLLQSEIELNRQKANLILKQQEQRSSKRIFNQLLARNPETNIAVEDEKGLSTSSLLIFDPTQILQKNLNLKLLESEKK
ncbi:MAG: TolC family protein [Saprospiraceae bacterium]|nr:TolC family protein [Saprospiraceae bacterium]